MQACFKGQVATQSILSFPLLRELTAVEQLLAHQLAPPLNQQCRDPELKLPANDGTGNRQMTSRDPPNTAVADSAEDTDFTCAICMVCIHLFQLRHLSSSALPNCSAHAPAAGQTPRHSHSKQPMTIL